MGQQGMFEHLFAYGTLRSGEANDIGEVAKRHDMANPENLGWASVTGYLHDFGNYPGLVIDKAGHAVLGQIFHFPHELLPILDDIEEFYPDRPSLFERTETTVTANGREIACYVYVVGRDVLEKHPAIVDGDWVTYRRRR